MQLNGGSSEPDHQNYMASCYCLWRRLRDALARFTESSRIRAELTSEHVELADLVYLLFSEKQEQDMPKTIETFNEVLGKYLEQEALLAQKSLDSLDQQLLTKLQARIETGERDLVTQVAEIRNKILSKGSSYSNRSTDYESYITNAKNVLAQSEQLLDKSVKLTNACVRNREQKDPLLRKASNLKRKLALCYNVLTIRNSVIFKYHFEHYISLIHNGQYKELEQSFLDIFSECKLIEDKIFPSQLMQNSGINSMKELVERPSSEENTRVYTRMENNIVQLTHIENTQNGTLRSNLLMPEMSDYQSIHDFTGEIQRFEDDRGLSLSVKEEKSLDKELEDIEENPLFLSWLTRESSNIGRGRTITARETSSNDRGRTITTGNSSLRGRRRRRGLQSSTLNKNESALSEIDSDENGKKSRIELMHTSSSIQRGFANDVGLSDTCKSSVQWRYSFKDESDDF